ncbi:MAG: outer membrane beta-barrel protein, partial [Flavobacteriaceae bacterium]
LKLKENTSYTLQISYVGMITHHEIITTSENDMIKNFNLMPDNTLDQVELIYEMPVTIKGDTLVYNADSFMDETDKKLEDVLKKLPGVDINDDGEIEVEGKVVDKVMVEGKDFFDGDTKLATKNIPADALDKVQVLRNYDEVSQLQNVRSNEDNIAINIKLKEGKKNFWFGEITAGLGPDERYLAHPKLFYYSPKYSINIITDINNIGEVPFTMRDYFKFTGGFKGLHQRSGTGFNVEAQDMGFLTMQNNKAKAIDTKFGAANFSYSPKKTWDLSGFAIYSGTRTDLEQNSIKRYVQSETGDIPPPDETTQSKTHQKVDLGLFKLSSSYKPNSKNHLDYDIFGKVSKQNEYQDFYSSILQNIDEVQEQSPFSLNQNFNYYYTLNEKNIFALEVQHLWQDENPFYNAALEQSDQFQFTDILGLDTNQSILSTAQDKRVKTNKVDAKIDYWYVLNQKSNLNFTLGTLLSKQQFDSNIYQILDNGSHYELENAQVDILNDVKFNFSDVYLGLHYRLKSGIFTFSPGFSVHSYTTKNQQFGSQVKDNFIRLLPDFDTRIQLKKSETLNLRYNMQNSFTDVDQLAEAAVFNNYNVLYQGNRNLENSLSHNLNLSYYSFNMFNYTNVFTFVNYSKRVDEIRSRSEFLTYPNPIPGEPDIQTTSQLSTSFNSNFADESIMADARFEKSFSKIKASIGANISYTKFNQKNKFYTQSPFANMDVYFLNSFIFKADYSYFNFKNEQQTLNNYSFFDASLSYQKKDSKWEYKVGATNILNTKSLNQDNSNTLYTSVSEYFIQPRYIMFSIKYNL